MGLKYRAPVLLFESAFHSQTKYYMQAYGEKWVSDRGFRFHSSEISRAITMLLLALVAWYFLAQCGGWLMRHLKVLWCVMIGGLAAAVALAMKLPFLFALYSHRYSTEFAVFPTGIFWLACGVFVWSTGKPTP